MRKTRAAACALFPTGTLGKCKEVAGDPAKARDATTFSKLKRWKQKPDFATIENKNNYKQMREVTLLKSGVQERAPADGAFHLVVLVLTTSPGPSSSAQGTIICITGPVTLALQSSWFGSSEITCEEHPAEC